MNGAVALLSTLRANGVEVCFANPGTSEMHFVAATDAVPSCRPVLCLFEGVATGAADGYARVTGKPAATLLHLGPGLSNGLANLHNARRAHVPLLNIVGDHATYHSRYDAPLQSDIESLARTVSGWYRRSSRAEDVAADTADAVAATFGPPGQIATLVLPADASWSEIAVPPSRWPTGERMAASTPPAAQLNAALAALRSPGAALLIGGDAMRAAPLELAARLTAATGARLFAETFSACHDHGAGVVAPEHLVYLSEFAIDQLKDVTTLVLIGATAPVGFFAYPSVASRLSGPGCEIVTAAPVGSDVVGALTELVAASGAAPWRYETGERPQPPSGPCTPTTTAQAIGATLPEDVIIVDEANTGSIHLHGATRFAPPHEWLLLTGGAIGYGLPAALGAAVGGGGRRVLAIEADGSLLYTPQALWSMAREGLDVTVVAMSNRSYAILNLELQRVGASSAGTAARRLLDLDDPELRLADMAASLGVPGERVESAEALVTALEKSYAAPGPSFIEVMHGKGFG